MTDLDTNTLRCATCQQAVTADRKPNRTLVVACDCTRRPIKVSRVLPDHWR